MNLYHYLILDAQAQKKKLISKHIFFFLISSTNGLFDAWILCCGTLWKTCQVCTNWGLSSHGRAQDNKFNSHPIPQISRMIDNNGSKVYHFIPVYMIVFNPLANKATFWCPKDLVKKVLELSKQKWKLLHIGVEGNSKVSMENHFQSKLWLAIVPFYKTH